MTADATDQASIDSVVKQTKVVIACAGPYAKLGTPVVDACVRLGAHCVDITGSLLALMSMAPRGPLAVWHLPQICRIQLAVCQVRFPIEWSQERPKVAIHTAWHSVLAHTLHRSMIMLNDTISAQKLQAMNCRGLSGAPGVAYHVIWQLICSAEPPHGAWRLTGIQNRALLPAWTLACRGSALGVKDHQEVPR